MTPALAAVCPDHPQSPSVATCSRCGRFVCAVCLRSDAPPLCPACAPRVADPLGVLSAPFSFGNAVGYGVRMLLPVWGKALLLSVLFSIPGGWISWLSAPADDESLTQVGRSIQRSNIYDALVGSVGEVAVILLCIGVAEGRRLSLGQALRESLSRYGRLFSARFRSGVWILAFTLLFVLPGVWKAVLLAFAVPAAVRIEAMDALKLSTLLVTPRWWAVFGRVTAVMALFLVPAVLFVGVFDFAVGFLELPRLPVEVVEDWATRTAEYLVSACLLAGFYGLCFDAKVSLEPMAWRTGQRGPMV